MKNSAPVSQSRFDRGRISNGEAVVLARAEVSIPAPLSQFDGRGLLGVGLDQLVAIPLPLFLASLLPKLSQSLEQFGQLLAVAGFPQRLDQAI